MIITGTIILIIIAAALAAPIISPYRYDETNFSNTLKSPSFKHPMGTDQEGRDMLSRIIFGSRVSITVALGTAAMALFIGTIFGALSGYIGGKIDEFMMRIVDIFYSLPDLLVIVLFTLIIGKGVKGIVISLGLTSWMRVARIIRGSVLQIKSYEYVESAKALGAKPYRILFKHILPNALSPLIITVTFSVPYAILTESTLSFLGLGIAPPESSWGTLASTGWQGMRTFPHLIVFPSLAIFITSLCFNLFGEGIRDILDPDNTYE
ncbi:MAG: ABC transporter permease subunit [Candidatus Dadabacteria bacterium]|nr:ABC transporter permease subunit [Candidatus Dadabacteria bacterium]NIQ16959.1 ABC transporter permease subunit [Candidatus Dadabacteria bacterium]